MNDATQTLTHTEITSFNQIRPNTRILFNKDTSILVEGAERDGDFMVVSGRYVKGDRKGYIAGKFSCVSDLLPA